MRDDDNSKQVTSFDELWDRVSPLIPTSTHTVPQSIMDKATYIISEIENNLGNPLMLVAPAVRTIATKAIQAYATHKAHQRLDKIFNNKNNNQNINYNMARDYEYINEYNAQKGNFSNDDLGAVYTPASEHGRSVETVVPDSMYQETNDALARCKIAVGGSMDNFVRDRLGFDTFDELYDDNILSAEQIDAVALAIYNIEAKGQGVIIGDQTGIGKGRIAGAMIRYAIQQGKLPIFFTEKANLFSDLYRDLISIQSGFYRPLIVNAKEKETDIKDTETGEVYYTGLENNNRRKIFASGVMPDGYDVVISTYSQFNKDGEHDRFGKKKPTDKQDIEAINKRKWLLNIAKDSILILDESHNSAGSSNTGRFMQKVIDSASGVVYLSATFAKRPDNMAVYAKKTAISDANMNDEQLKSAIQRGGVALQEILSSQLVKEGQMVRRERTYEGIDVNYLTTNDRKDEHYAISDRVTKIIRDIINFQENYIAKQVDIMDDNVKKIGAEIEITKGTKKAGVDNKPYVSRVFNIINQLIFSIKMKDVADRAILRLREGKAVVIAVSSTMETFIKEDVGISVGEEINTDFATVLEKGLHSVMKITETDYKGDSVVKFIEISELSQQAQDEYYRILDEIRSASTGITLSPIDVLTTTLSNAGYTVSEVTGRSTCVKFVDDTYTSGVVSRLKERDRTIEFTKFNNNKVDVLIISQTGSTGASAHAKPNKSVPPHEVKQRVMIVAQAELNINTEMQKRGRINRTGQILKPIYDYVISPVPAEQRFMMMLQKKLKSLDANTAGNQKQSSSMLDVPDFLNKIGDKVVLHYLIENPEFNTKISDPLDLKEIKSDDPTVIEKMIEDSEDDSGNFKQGKEVAHIVTGRVAILNTVDQEEFYTEITKRYIDEVEYLKSIDEYNLEVETVELQAETKKSEIIVYGKGGNSSFGTDSVLEEIECNNLKKPLTGDVIVSMLNNSLSKIGGDVHAYVRNEVDKAERYFQDKEDAYLQERNARMSEQISNIENEKRYLKLLEKKDNGEDVEAELLAYKETRIEDIKKANKQSIDNYNDKSKNQLFYFKNYFKKLPIGKVLSVQSVYFMSGQASRHLGVVIDWDINPNAKNPYAPSAIKVKIAIADGRKMINLALSNSSELNSLLSHDAQQYYNLDDLKERWNKTISQKMADRVRRYIITGNILQASGNYNGKLIAYTTLDGTIRKGLLLPDGWTKDDGTDNPNANKIVTSIWSARNLVASLMPNKMLNIADEIFFFANYETLIFNVPKSNARGGIFFNNENLIKIAKQAGNPHGFSSSGNKMIVRLPKTDRQLIFDFIKVLNDELNITVAVDKDNADILDNTTNNSIVKKIIPPSSFPSYVPRSSRTDDDLAHALALQMQLAEAEMEILDLELA